LNATDRGPTAERLAKSDEPFRYRDVGYGRKRLTYVELAERRGTSPQAIGQLAERAKAGVSKELTRSRALAARTFRKTPPVQIKERAAVVHLSEMSVTTHCISVNTAAAAVRPIPDTEWAPATSDTWTRRWRALFL
jgi:hypothetical protein